MAIKKSDKDKKGQKKKDITQSFLTMDGSELLKMEKGYRKELFDLRMKIKTASYANVSDVHKAKRNIARIKTALRQREIAESKK